MCGLNALVLNAESSTMCQCFIRERKQSTSPWSHLTKTSSDLNSLLHSACVFFPLLHESDGEGFLGGLRVNGDSMCSMNWTWWVRRLKGEQEVSGL